jgi:heme-degrading monooxygenase HmoA
MILEVVMTQVVEGKEAEFEAAHRRGSDILARAAGYLGHELRRCSETKGRYLNFVRWETVEHHMVSFRGSPAYQEFRALVSPFYAATPQMEHYQLVYGNDPAL